MPLVPTMRWEYDKTGAVTKTVDPDGNQTDTVYDAFGRPSFRLDPRLPINRLFGFPGGVSV